MVIEANTAEDEMRVVVYYSRMAVISPFAGGISSGPQGGSAAPALRGRYVTAGTRCSGKGSDSKIVGDSGDVVVSGEGDAGGNVFVCVWVSVCELKEGCVCSGVLRGLRPMSYEKRKMVVVVEW